MQTQHTSKTKFLDAALSLIRTKGYAPTTVGDVCAEAGVTTGSFFHRLPGAVALGVAGAGHFAEVAEGMFATCAYRGLDDPLGRLLGYVHFPASLLPGDIAHFTCHLGT